MNRTLELNVKGNRYVVEFPNIGRFQQIESIKQVLSKGMYSSLLNTSTISSIEALDMIDMEAYFTVLVPQMVKDLKCDVMSDLGIEDYLELKQVYQKQFVPWWNDIMKMLNPKVQKDVE